MRRRIVEANGEKYLEETYYNFEELVSTIKSRTKKMDSDSTKDNNNSWKGIPYDEAVENLIRGYCDQEAEEQIKKLKTEVDKFKRTIENNGVRFENNIVGFAPNVPNAIIGLPKNMISSKSVPKKSKVISIIVDMGVNGGTDQGEYFKVGLNIIKKIVELEHKGFRVRLEYMNTYNNRNRHDLFRVLLKSENQSLDIKRIAFPLLRKEMERRIGFSWKERLDGSLLGDRYGAAIDSLETLKPLLNPNEYAMRFYDDINVILKDVK